MLVESNAYADLKTNRAGDIFDAYAGKILLPDRIRWNTAHVVALYSKKPILSNIFYSVNLNVDTNIKDLMEKSLVLWLNTTWGLLTVLISRQETEGAWSRLKMAQWRLLPILDITKIGLDTLKELAKIFDNYANKVPRRIPEQFNPENPDPVRLGIDLDFLRALNPDINFDKAKDSLLKLYKHIHNALTLWIG